MPKPTSVQVPAEPSSLQVKFQDSLKVRPSNGSLISMVGADLSALLSIQYQYGLTFEAGIDVPQSTFDFIEGRAAQTSGIAQPDLGGVVAVLGPSGNMQAAASALIASGDTEWVDFVTESVLTCEDWSELTPDYWPTSTEVAWPIHLGEPYFGTNMICAWAYGGRGAGVQVTDIELGFRPTSSESDPIHEDLCVVDVDGPASCYLEGANHGLSVLGIIAALDNEYGWTGLTPDVSLRFETVRGPCNISSDNVAGALTKAIAASQPGDIINIVVGHLFQGISIPVEFRPFTWTMTKLASDSGILVTMGAGNGNALGQGVDLDYPLWFQHWIARGDSGSIIVGAGSHSAVHDRLPFSNYGTKVTVQGGGENIFALALNAFGEYPFGQYTQVFAGTSSATPVVSSAAASIQSMLACRGLPPLSSLEMRQLLIDSGIPQGDAVSSGKKIGPFPNMAKAVLELGIGATDVNGNSIPDCCDGSASSAPVACCIADGITCVLTTICWCEQMCGTVAPTATCKPWSCQSINGPQGEP